MKRYLAILSIFLGTLFAAGCTTSYKAKPLSFKTPAAYDNVVDVAGAQAAAKAYVDPIEAKESFGFDIRQAGMLPIQVVFDNMGKKTLGIDGEKTFLEDNEGNLWPVLSGQIAYERVTKYAQTNEIVKQGAYHGMLGAAAGAIIGVAVGIVTGEDVGASVGKGAAVGAAAGATMGGAAGYGDGDVRRAIMDDFHEKSLNNKPIQPGGLSHGIIFFPGEAGSARQLRLLIVEQDSGKHHNVRLVFK